jgi:hypothetical protein
MNDRIQKLAEQAAGNFTQTFRWEYIQEIDRDIFNKFAELIVRECANIADRRPAVLIDQTTGDFIKKHFGVE